MSPPTRSLIKNVPSRPQTAGAGRRRDASAVAPTPSTPGGEHKEAAESPAFKHTPPIEARAEGGAVKAGMVYSGNVTSKISTRAVSADRRLHQPNASLGDAISYITPERFYPTIPTATLSAKVPVAWSTPGAITRRTGAGGGGEASESEKTKKEAKANLEKGRAEAAARVKETKRKEREAEEAAKQKKETDEAAAVERLEKIQLKYAETLAREKEKREEEGRRKLAEQAEIEAKLDKKNPEREGKERELEERLRKLRKAQTKLGEEIEEFGTKLKKTDEGQDLRRTSSIFVNSQKAQETLRSDSLDQLCVHKTSERRNLEVAEGGGNGGGGNGGGEVVLATSRGKDVGVTSPTTPREEDVGVTSPTTPRVVESAVMRKVTQALPRKAETVYTLPTGVVTGADLSAEASTQTEEDTIDIKATHTEASTQPIEIQAKDGERSGSGGGGGGGGAENATTQKAEKTSFETKLDKIKASLKKMNEESDSMLKEIKKTNEEATNRREDRRKQNDVLRQRIEAAKKAREESMASQKQLLTSLLSGATVGRVDVASIASSAAAPVSKKERDDIIEDIIEEVIEEDGDIETGGENQPDSSPRRGSATGLSEKGRFLDKNK